ncbi:MAG: hypothetical protein RL328_2098 [Acidobacteriota bacterium]|jgi:peptidoglycan hydrolase-like protein with peptidoglycan-binding domain
MRALILSLAVALSLSPLAAKTSATSTSPKATASKKTAKTTSAKNKTKKPVRVAQQHPSSERYLEIEQALVDRGYLEQADGNWGNESVVALKKFQQDQELTADGKLGALSLTALGLGPRRGAFVVAPPVPVSSSAPVAAD